MRLANRTASWLQVATIESSLRSRYLAMVLKRLCANALRALIPRSSVRNDAVRALIARAGSATTSSRFVVRTRNATHWPSVGECAAV